MQKRVFYPLIMAVHRIIRESYEIFGISGCTHKSMADSRLYLLPAMLFRKVGTISGSKRNLGLKDGDESVVLPVTEHAVVISDKIRAAVGFALAVPLGDPSAEAAGVVHRTVDIVHHAVLRADKAAGIGLYRSSGAGDVQPGVLAIDFAVAQITQDQEPAAMFGDQALGRRVLADRDPLEGAGLEGIDPVVPSGEIEVEAILLQQPGEIQPAVREEGFLELIELLARQQHFAGGGVDQLQIDGAVVRNPNGVSLDFHFCAAFSLDDSRSPWKNGLLCGGRQAKAGGKRGAQEKG